MARSVNKVILIGNLTRDPELRKTTSGTSVCNFGIATNREWKNDAGEKNQETEFHNCVAWNKLADIAAEYLRKGKHVYVEGRLATRSWESQDGQKKSVTEIILSDMIMLERRPQGQAEAGQDQEEVMDQEAEIDPATIPF